MSMFGRWYNKTFCDPDGNFDHLPDWHKDDMRMAWDAATKAEQRKSAKAIFPLVKALEPMARLRMNYEGNNPSDAVFAKGCVYVYELRKAQEAINKLREIK